MLYPFQILFNVGFVLLFVTVSFADEIILKSGDRAITQIVDTSGCEVKIIRYGNPVTIKKKLIEKVIWKTDTISYDCFICLEKVKPIVITCYFQINPIKKGLFENS